MSLLAFVRTPVKHERMETLGRQTGVQQGALSPLQPQRSPTVEGRVPFLPARTRGGAQALFTQPVRPVSPL